MKIAINIKVRNPEWYWTKEQLLESKEPDSMSREEWEMFYGDQIPKHIYAIDFDYTFEVKSYVDKRDTNYNLTLYTFDNANFDNETKHNVTLDNVTVIEFNGDSEKSFVVVSNEIIHQFISSKPREDGHLYWYFYIKENVDHERLSDNIWISGRLREKIAAQLGSQNLCIVKKDPNLQIRKLEPQVATRHQPWQDF